MKIKRFGKQNWFPRIKMLRNEIKLEIRKAGTMGHS